MVVASAGALLYAGPLPFQHQPVSSSYPPPPPLHAQAVAKLRFDDTVIRSDVDAAIALMRASQASIEPELQKRTREDPVSRLYLVGSFLFWRVGVC